MQTSWASRYLAQLCEHFATASRAEWDERSGFTDFGWGRCTLVATRDALLEYYDAWATQGIRAWAHGGSAAPVRRRASRRIARGWR